MRFTTAARGLLVSFLVVSLTAAQNGGAGAAKGGGTPGASAAPGSTTAPSSTPPTGSAPGVKDPNAAKSGSTSGPRPNAPGGGSTTTSGGALPNTGSPGGAAPPPSRTAPTSAVGGSTGRSASASKPAPAPDDSTMDGATYAVRLRDLESKVDELKEQIRRSHTRLSLLSDTILGGGVGGARAEIRFRNEMSSAFHLTRALFVLDGAVQYNKQDDTGALAAQTEIPIFSGSIPPGDHTLQVLIQLRGHGYGVFSYLRGYKFEVKSSHAFTVTEGKTIELEVTAWEKGGVTTPLEQRPAVRYLEKIRNGTGETEPGSSGSSGGSTSVSGSFSVGTGKK